MNLRKRGLALLMCICMIFTLLPFSVFAEDAENGSRGGTEGTAQPSVVYGTYDEDGLNWTPDSTITDPTQTYKNVTYSKTAAPVQGADNTYDITLNVSTTVKKAAVVLVVDTSDASKCCAECGQKTTHKYDCEFKSDPDFKASEITDAQSFLTAEKAAASEFVAKYSGSAEGTGKYLQIVSFSGTANTVLEKWVDVSTATGKDAALKAIAALTQSSAATDNGKNLEQGLAKAYNCFTTNAPKNVTDKYTIVMTSGWCNAYDEDSKTGPDTKFETGQTAEKLRGVSTVFAVRTRNFEIEYQYGGTFDNFLMNDVATSGCSYLHDQNTRYKVSYLKSDLGRDIIEQLKIGVAGGFTVTDPMGGYVELINTSLNNTNAIFDELKFTITWTPTATSISQIVDNENGSVTVNYQLKYAVALKTDAEGFVPGEWYPTNYDTKLVFVDGMVYERRPDYSKPYINPTTKEPILDANGNPRYEMLPYAYYDNIVTLHFIVPGVKAAEYDVTYKYVDEDFNEIEDSALKAPVDPKSYAVGAEFSVVAAPAKTDIPGYDFVDWYAWYLDEYIAVKTNAVLEMEKGGVTIYGMLTRSETSYIVNYIWNGKHIADSETFDCKVGDVIKYGGVATDNSVKPVEIEGYTAKPVALSELKISETETQNVINFYYYKNVEITAKSDSVVYDGKEHSVSGFTGAPEDADFSAITVGAEGTKVDVYPAEFAAETVGTVDNTGNYIITKATNGQLEITSRPYIPPVNPSITDKITVEITGNSDSVVYDGTEHSVKDYTVKISDSRYTEKDFTFSGKALASGVNAGAYEMGLKADQFKNTNARFTNVEFIIKADGVLTITQRPLTITAGSAEGIAPVTCDKYTVEGLATGDKVDSVKITGIQSEPGESPNVASDAVIKNAKGEDVTANYKITYVNGVLKAIEVLNKEIHFNYVIGYTDGTIRPNNDISRAEVATIFFRLLTDEARTQYTTTAGNFTDVKAGMWCNRAIATLTNMGIIKGYTDGSFQPNKSITRAELATIIARFAKLDVNTKTFSDINGHWAQKNIELAAGNGWINGYEDGTFRPNKSIIRAETFAMINRVLDRQTESVSDLLPTSEMNMWSDNLNENAWYYKDVQEATNYHKCDRVGDSVYEKWTEKVPDIDWASYQI